jgi:hypothetical protein
MVTAGIPVDLLSREDPAFAAGRIPDASKHKTGNTRCRMNQEIIFCKVVKAIIKSKAFLQVRRSVQQ